MVSAARGVTLIELMTVILIMSILIALGVPLTSRWIHSAHVADSYSLLMQGYDQTRAVALRNPTGAIDSINAAAGMKLVDGNTLYVCRGNPSDGACDAGGGAVAWSADLARGHGVAITIGDSTDATLSLNSTGIALNTPSERTYRVSKGAEAREGRLE